MRGRSSRGTTADPVQPDQPHPGGWFGALWHRFCVPARCNRSFPSVPAASSKALQRPPPRTLHAKSTGRVMQARPSPASAVRSNEVPTRLPAGRNAPAVRLSSILSTEDCDGRCLRCTSISSGRLDQLLGATFLAPTWTLAASPAPNDNSSDANPTPQRHAPTAS